MVKKSHFLVLFICTAVIGVLFFKQSFGYRTDLQYCGISQYMSSDLYAINPWATAVIYFPTSVLMILSILLNIYAWGRLKKGLPDTYALRMKAVTDAYFYTTGFTVYFAICAVAYFIVWTHSYGRAFAQVAIIDSQHVSHYIFAVSMGLIGVVDFLLWYMRKFRMFNRSEILHKYSLEVAGMLYEYGDDGNECIDNLNNDRTGHRLKRKIRNISIKEANFIAPLNPKTVYDSNQISMGNKLPVRAKKHFWQLTLHLIVYCIYKLIVCIFYFVFRKLSIKPTVDELTINKALRREVLAYTTDGIAQSVERAFQLSSKSVVRNRSVSIVFPRSISEEHGIAVQRFAIKIRYNKDLLYTQMPKSDFSFETPDTACASCCVFNKHPQHLQASGMILEKSDLEDDTHYKNMDYMRNDKTKSMTKGTDTINMSFIDKFQAGRYTTEVLVDNSKGEIGKERSFVDYAPLVFRRIRNEILEMSDDEYIRSIIPRTEKAQRGVLDAKYGEGQSGAFFYFTHDSRFLVKTISSHEVQLMLDILPEYEKYLRDNKDTLITRCLGIHSCTMYASVKYFVVMENVFIAKLKPHEVYDLKGSWQGRYTHHGPRTGKTMKDLDLKRFIILSKRNLKFITKQLAKDTQFLADHQIMDYSLLLGIYHMTMATDNPMTYSQGMDEMKERLEEYAGGVRAQITEGPGIYYMGVIDTLQKYNWKKKLERFFKVYVQRKDRNAISCMDPQQYRSRFLIYMKAIMIDDNAYYRELKLSPRELKQQTVFVYPPHKIVDNNMRQMTRHGMRSIIVVEDENEVVNDNSIPSFEVEVPDTTAKMILSMPITLKKFKKR